MEIKKKTTEKEENPQIPVIRSFVETGIKRQKEIADNLADDHNKDCTALNRIFVEVIRYQFKDKMMEMD